MTLDDHLIYIDITKMCGIGCDFCMYADQHTNKERLVLTSKSKENISKLINHKEIKRVSISGEGEPLNNIKTFKEILCLSQGGIAFEFITSGFIPHGKLIKLYEDINKIIISNGDTCNIRLSTDSYHVAKIEHKPHAISIKYCLDQDLKSMTFSFRSIDTDKEFTRKYLKKELGRLNLRSTIKTKDSLEEYITVGNHEFQIEYKNLVKPSFLHDTKYMTLPEYIAAKERKSGKVFTLGNINPLPQSNGMGITIKPNGDVFFYGIESNYLANIHSDVLNINYFKDFVRDNKLINLLYTTPFMQLMDKISTNEAIKTLIIETNNPYWIIKEIMKYDKTILARMVEND